jgi:endonuclease/exonuclease/phosphatase family metal-dependent hydrolase
MKKLLKLLLGIVLIPVLAFAAFLLYITLADYKPADMKPLQSIQRNSQPINPDEPLKFISWNMGYAGLGSEMDFFYDGGQQVRASKELTNIYLEQILSFLKRQETIDFILLQEVDFDAKRSYRVNQSNLIADALPAHNFSTAINYKVSYVPVPLSEPMGGVEAGMMQLSKYVPSVENRHAYPQILPWPDRLFLLDRCFTESRFNLPNGKELVVLNTHNSAFVDQQELMDKELAVIKAFMLLEYQKGNYVVAGGDWNMNPPDFKPAENYNGHIYAASAVAITNDYLPGDWIIAFDPTTPTNRHLHQAFEKGVTPTTTIDFFIVSPNVQVLKLEAIDLDFANSDHNPVFIELMLK